MVRAPNYLSKILNFLYSEAYFASKDSDKGLYTYILFFSPIETVLLWI